jgi:hypothetical protein
MSGHDDFDRLWHNIESSTKSPFLNQTRHGRNHQSHEQNGPLLQTKQFTVNGDNKRYKHDYHYRLQRLAFAPMVANTLGKYGPDLLQFLLNLSDLHNRLNLGYSVETTNNLSTQQSIDYRKL